MYLEYYGLTEPPFDITPNPRFLFYSTKHREAFNHVLYGIRERKGFVQLTGEVGAGKTTLCRAMLEQLTGHYSTALILNPALNPDQLMKAITTEFGLPIHQLGLDRVDSLALFNEFLLRQVEQGKETVLIIDEAQDLPDEMLEQVRLLSNLETDDRKLLQIVLMGQTELRDRLNQHAMRQLRQRITVRYHLNPLSQQEVNQYVEHRLHVSGANGSAPYFTRPALWRVFNYSKGIPRLVNAICDKALLAGYVERRRKIGYGTVGNGDSRIGGEHTLMSMINDALKRAQKKSPSATGGPQLRPAEPSQFANQTLSLMVPVLLIFAVSIGVFFLWEAFQNPARNPEPVKAKTVTPEIQNPEPVKAKIVIPENPAPVKAKTVVAENPQPKVAPQPVQKIVQQPVQKVAQQPVRPVQMAAISLPKPKPETPKPAPAPVSVPQKTEPAPTPAPAPVVIAPPPTPVRLQAIFYTPGRSTAMINGKTVQVGDALKEYRVVYITQTSVKLISYTQTNVLTLPAQ